MLDISYLLLRLELLLWLIGIIHPPLTLQVRYVMSVDLTYRYNNFTTLLDSWFSGGAEPVPDSGLINGVGRYNGGPQIPWARISVTSGKRYRFRLVSLSAAGRFCSLKSNSNAYN